ncbi:hypothetical protein H920_08632, partial [Fukomys damarensis]
RWIVDFKAHKRVTSYAGCMAQRSPFLDFGCFDDMHLPAMDDNQNEAVHDPLI